MLGFLGLGAESKKSDRKPPEHPLRKRIQALVALRAGINEARIRRELGLRRSTCRHHLRLLLDAGLIARVPKGRENHYFPSEMDAKTMDTLASATHGRAKSVLREVFIEPGIAQVELAQRVGMTRKVLRTYLDFLGDHGLLVERHASGHKRYWPGQAVDEVVWDRVVHNPIAHQTATLPSADREPGEKPVQPADALRRWLR